MCRLNHREPRSQLPSAHRWPAQFRGIVTLLQKSLWFSSLLLAGTGCSMVENATQNLFIDPWHYFEPFENHRELAKDAQLAAVAWSQVVAAHPGPYSPDYATGFKAGYVDYLYSGNCGAPSPLPPRKYWGTAYQTPAGRQAIADYFAGFRHGTAAAQASGQRELVTLPLNRPPMAHGHEWSSPAPGLPTPGWPNPAWPEQVPTPAPIPPGGFSPNPGEMLPTPSGPGFTSRNTRTSVPVDWSSRTARQPQRTSPPLERLPSTVHQFR